MRGALVGAMIAGMAGLGWTQWGASGLSGAAAGAIRVAGVVIGLIIFLWSARAWRFASGRSGSMFSSRAYGLVVVLMVVAVVGGNQLLGATEHHEYTIAWDSSMVGLHFLAFGRLFWAGFYWLGTALITAAIAGSIVGFAGGGSEGIKATSGLIAAASLFAAGGTTIGRARARTHP